MSELKSLRNLPHTLPFKSFFFSQTDGSALKNKIFFPNM